MSIANTGRSKDPQSMEMLRSISGEPKTLSVPDAGMLYFGLGKNASYAAAARGELPVIKIGNRLRVSVVALERKLAEAGKDGAA